MSGLDPVSAAVTAMGARRQQAYVKLITHMQGCRGCDDHPLCDDGQALWNTWKGRDGEDLRQV
jgi:hypothetical protein